VDARLFLYHYEAMKLPLLAGLLGLALASTAARAAAEDDRRWSLWCQFPGVPVMNVWQDRRGIAWLRVGRGPLHVGEQIDDGGRYLRFVTDRTALHFRAGRDLSGVSLMVEIEPGGYSAAMDLACEVTIKPPEFRRPEPAQPAMPRFWPNPRAVRRT
jgi:hypothetical protein